MEMSTGLVQKRGGAYCENIVQIVHSNLRKRNLLSKRQTQISTTKRVAVSGVSVQRQVLWPQPRNFGTAAV